jgi:glycosyltransferase involved in cell wall biosynthesis
MMSLAVKHPSSIRVLVAQRGAREHYAVARALHQRGMLAGLVTDWYAPVWGGGRRQKSGAAPDRRSNESHRSPENDRLTNGTSTIPIRKAVQGPVTDASVFQQLQRRYHSALAARCDDLPDQLIHSFPLRSAYWKWKMRNASRRGSIYEGYAETDAGFARAVAGIRLPPHDVFFGYSYASLEMLELEKERGMFTVVDQVDPGPVEYRLVAEEMARHPEMAGQAAPFPESHFDRARREWNLADMIVVNSEWSRTAIIAEGAAAEKIEVVPLCYEKAGENERAGKVIHKSAGPLRVLFLGQVNVRKGIHHLIEAALRLVNEPVEFLIAGQPDLRPGSIAKAPPNMRWIGAVPRGQVSSVYEQSDVFVLPTLSDGFAITQLEAMKHGLPVIVTPNCGRVVEDGKTGFIVPPGDIRGLVDAIRRFIDDRNLANAMRPHCAETAMRYTLDGFGQTLIEAIKKHRGKELVHGT